MITLNVGVVGTQRSDMYTYDETAERTCCTCWRSEHNSLTCTSRMEPEQICCICRMSHLSVDAQATVAN